MVDDGLHSTQASANDNGNGHLTPDVDRKRRAGSLESGNVLDALKDWSRTYEQEGARGSVRTGPAFVR